MSENINVTGEDVKKLVDFLARYSQEDIAKLMNQLRKDDEEKLHEISEVVTNNQEKHNKIMAANERRIKESQELGNPTRKPLKEFTIKTKEFISDAKTELIGYAKEAKEKIVGFWDKTIADGKAAMEQAKQKLKEVGKDGANLVAAKFAKDFNQSAIKHRESQIELNNRQIGKSEKNIEKLNKIKEGLNRVNERSILIRSAFVGFSKDPKEFQEKHLDALKNSKGYVDRLIDDEKDLIDMFSSENENYRADIEKCEMIRDRSKETLDQVIEKYKKEVDLEKTNTKEQTRTRDTVDRDDR